MKTTIVSLLLLTTLLCRPAFCGEIHDAAKNGDLEKVKALLKTNPALVFSKDDAGFTPLHWAAIKGCKEVAELLLANKADVNAKNDYGMMPLHAAVAYHNKAVVELLLTNYADVNAKDSAGDTPLQLATSSGFIDLAELLRQHGGQDTAIATTIHRRPKAVIWRGLRRYSKKILIWLTPKTTPARRRCTTRRLMATRTWWNCC